MSDITVIVATFGSEEWNQRGQEAFKSLNDQTLSPAESYHYHGSTLAEARNSMAQLAESSHLIFLDGDDRLDPGYVEAMQKALDESRARNDHRTFLFQPASLGVVDGKEDPFPVLIPEKPMDQGNFLIIGTMVEREHFLKVGGFDEWEAWEDYACWWKCIKAGAGVFKVPDAIYKVYVNENGRNASAANNYNLGLRIRKDIESRSW